VIMTESILIMILSFLQENQVQSSQDLTAFFSPLEVKKVAKELVPSIVEEQDDEASVEFLGESGNSLVDYPHHRFDYVEFVIGKDPMKYCGNCFCIICDARAADGCTDWNAHCSTTKQEYEVLMHTRVVARLEAVLPVSMEEGDNEKQQEIEEEAKHMTPAVVLELVPKTEEQGEAKDRDFVLSLLKMEEKELKALCQEKKKAFWGLKQKKEQLHC